MPNTGPWGFFSLLLLIAVGFFLFSGDIFGLRTFFGTAGTTFLGTSGTMTLLCSGGEGAACCHNDAHEYTPAMTITIDHVKGLVYVFVEGQGSAIGRILEDVDGHLLFGRKPSDECKDTAPQGCKIASGEISRLTGVADVKVIDRDNKTEVEWDKLGCRHRWWRF